MTGIPLRRRLFVLTAAAILPLAVMAGLGLYVLARQQEVQAERVGLELARSVANAIDAELRSSIEVLETLANSPLLDGNELGGFEALALRVVRVKSEWAVLQLADPAGVTLVDTRATPHETLPSLVEKPSFDRVVRTQTPAVGHLTRHEEAGWGFAVRAPVVRDGRLKYVLSALVRPETIRQVLARQQVPRDWVISIVDANGLRVARSRAHDETLAGRLSPTVQQVVDRGGEEGFGLAYTLEGERIFTPYSRLPSTGWIAVLGIPTALVDAAAFRSTAVYGGGVLLSILLGGFAALRVARSITGPMAGLRAAAEALGRREVPRPPGTPLQEIREVGTALKRAAEDRAKGEMEREELLRKERHAREEAEAADRAKDEFMAVLSHELRTPLNAVFGWARLLQSGQVRDEAMIARAKDAIVRNADAQVKLIDDLLDLSRITSGKMRLDVRPVELPKVLQAALDAVRPAADAKGIRLENVMDPDARAVAGDPARLQQIVWNLLINAVKFTPRGGQVELRLRRLDAHMEIAVSDTGQGIPPAMLPHVFERFRQADSSSTRTHGGLGLGLALVRHLVELHGGTVVATSEGEGRGATFMVTLPIAVSEIRGTPPRPYLDALTPEALAEIVRLDGLRVLVVDDDGDALVLAETILTNAGAEVRMSLSAPDALARFLEWRPHVLVSDVEMPGEDGYSLIRKIRALPSDQGGETPAIALTAYNRPQDRLRSVAGGFSMHVPKPVDPGELTALIASVAGRQERPQPS